MRKGRSRDGETEGNRLKKRQPTPPSFFRYSQSNSLRGTYRENHHSIDCRHPSRFPSRLVRAGPTLPLPRSPPFLFLSPAFFFPGPASLFRCPRFFFEGRFLPYEDANGFRGGLRRSSSRSLSRYRLAARAISEDGEARDAMPANRKRQSA